MQSVCSRAIRGFAPLGLLALSALPSHAQFTQTGGTAGLTTLSSPTDVTPGAHESDSNFFVFSEKQNVVVTNLATNSGGAITGPVNSYMFYTDKLHGDGQGSQTYDITLKFTNQILGVIDKSGKLDNTDTLLGLSGTTYPTGDDERGQEGNDFFTLDTTTNTLTLHNQTFGDVNEIRVLTAIPELSTSLGFGSFIALGGLAAFRQRKGTRKVA
jgi:hypothetical protein